MDNIILSTNMPKLFLSFLTLIFKSKINKRYYWNKLIVKMHIKPTDVCNVVYKKKYMYYKVKRTYKICNLQQRIYLNNCFDIPIFSFLNEFPSWFEGRS